MKKSKFLERLEKLFQPKLTLDLKISQAGNICYKKNNEWRYFSSPNSTSICQVSNTLDTPVFLISKFIDKLKIGDIIFVKNFEEFAKVEEFTEDEIVLVNFVGSKIRLSKKLNEGFLIDCVYEIYSEIKKTYFTDGNAFLPSIMIFDSPESEKNIEKKNLLMMYQYMIDQNDFSFLGDHNPIMFFIKNDNNMNKNLEKSFFMKMNHTNNSFIF